jgi:hypothetical protein
MGYERRIPKSEWTVTLNKHSSIPYYRGYVRSLGLKGDERILDLRSGSGYSSRQIPPSGGVGGSADLRGCLSEGGAEIARQSCAAMPKSPICWDNRGT